MVKKVIVMNTSIDIESVRRLVSERKPGSPIELKNRSFENMDLSGWDLRNIDFSGSDFTSVNLDGADLDGASLHKTWFKDCSMRKAHLTHADVTEAGMRYLDLSGTDISGSNLYASILEYAILNNIIYDDDTKYYRLACPEEGAFIAWKCCTEWRVVQLLVPADARRVSATMDSCRCDKAKVLSIKSIDETISYTWAQSTVDPNFYYEVGKWVEPANGFEEDRWRDSSQGIHFFMKREQCVAYQTV